MAKVARVIYATRVRFVRVNIFLLFVLAIGVRADETLQQVQRELRARRYYFGPVDGRESRETARAIEEFQRAKAIDATGLADDETRRALGLKVAETKPSAEVRALQLGREWIARYCAACEGPDWSGEERFYAEKVRYFYEGEVTRDELRGRRIRERERWPGRREVPLLCYASWGPRRTDELWVSARVRHEMKGRNPAPTIVTEELLFILRNLAGEWRIVEVREWPLVKVPKDLP